MNNDVSTTFDSLYQELCNYFFTKFLFREIDLLMAFWSVQYSSQD